MKTYSRSVKSPCPVREQNIPDEYENSCRLCLTKDNIMIDIYNEDEIVPIPLKLRYCISLEVSEKDGLPCGICTDCMVKLDETYAFKKRCLATDVKLRQFIQVPTFSNIFTLDDSNSKDTTLAEHSIVAGNSRDACTIKMEDNGLLFINEFCRNNPVNKTNNGRNSINGINSSNVEVGNISIENHINAYESPTNENTLNINSYCTDDISGCNTSTATEELQEDLNIEGTAVETRRSTRLILRNKAAETIQAPDAYENEEFSGERLAEREAVEDEDKNCDREFRNSVLDYVPAGKKAGKPTYRCTPCNMTFIDYKELLDHKHSIHADSIKICSFCPKTFITNSTLERHLRTHTGVRPYACKHCDKKFSQKEILNRHTLVHNLDKRKIIKCNVCSYTCSTAEQLHRHIKMRHSDSSAKDHLPKFPCHKCNKTFYHLSGLSRHQAVHSGVVYQCTSCIKPFSDKSSVKRHFIKSHPDQSYKSTGTSVKYYQIATYQY